MNKKGDIYQILIVLIIVTACALVGLITLTMTHQINLFWDNHPEIMPNNSIAAQSNSVLEQTAPRTTDYAIFFIFLGSNIAVVISAVRTRFNAIMIFLFILLTLISIMISAGLVNMYQGIAHEDITSSVASELTLTNYILSKYTPLIISVISALVLIVMYGKSGGDIVT